MKFPNLYKSLQRGRELSPKSFLLWLCKSIYQAFVIVTMAVLCFETPMILMVTITFTALIFTQILNVVSEISRMNWIVGGSCILSLIVYFLCLIIFPDLLEASRVLDGEFVYAVTLTVLVAWLPLFLINYITLKYYPSEDQKLMKEATANRVRFLDTIVEKFNFWSRKETKDGQEKKDLGRELVDNPQTN